MTQVTKEPCATTLILSEQKPRKALLLNHKKHGFWVPPGGHVEPYENHLEAAIREVKEETGLDIAEYLPKPERVSGHVTNLPLPNYFVDVEVPNGDSNTSKIYSVQVYVAIVPEQAIKHDANDADESGWFTLEETENLKIAEDVRIVLRKEMVK